MNLFIIYSKNLIFSRPVGGTSAPDAVYGCSGKQEIGSCAGMRTTNIEGKG